MNHAVDFDLHNIVRLRLIHATARDIEAVERQIGPLRASLAGEPDIVVRFVDEFAERSEMRILGDWEAGYTDSAFWVLRGKHHCRIAVQLPLDRVGGACEIVSRHGAPALPLLGSIINLMALSRGYLPLHASAFRYRGTTILVMGWAKGGKTEALLGFSAQGATYVGDEWVYIDPEGRTLFGIPQPIQLWDWHLDSGCHRARLTAAQRAKLAALRIVLRALRAPAECRLLAGKQSARLLESLQRYRHVRATPARLFADNIDRSAPCPSQIFFLASHAASAIQVHPIPVDEIVARMAVSLEDEFAPLLACYRQYRFALPGRTNSLLDQLPQLLQQRLAQAFRTRQGWAVWHPYPVSPRALFEAMAPFVATGYETPEHSGRERTASGASPLQCSRNSLRSNPTSPSSRSGSGEGELQESDGHYVRAAPSVTGPCIEP